MQKYFLLSFLLFFSPAFAEDNMCSSGPVQQSIDSIQKCLQLQCPSQSPAQTRKLGSGDAGIFGLNGAISKLKELFVQETAKAPILKCSGDCNLRYFPQFRLHTYPTESVEGSCPKEFVNKTYHLVYKSTAANKNGNESACKPIIEKRAESFIRNILTCGTPFMPCNKKLEDDSIDYKGKKISSVDFNKLLTEELCPGECSLYSYQTTGYEKTKKDCTTEVILDVTCGEAKKSAHFNVEADIVENFQCVQP